MGQEVEYTISTRPNSTTAGSCLPAENVKTLQKGTIQQPKIFENVYNGEVVRPLRCVNPDQSEYCGLIKLSNENGDTMSTHEFGITSLTNKRHLLQKYDVVTFKKDENGRANEVCVYWIKFLNLAHLLNNFCFTDLCNPTKEKSQR